MKKWLLFLAVTLVVSCSSIECPLKNLVATNYEIYDSDGLLLELSDTLTIYSKTKEGKDTILLNRAIEIESFSLPISKSHPEDVLYFHFFAPNYDETDTTCFGTDEVLHPTERLHPGVPWFRRIVRSGGSRYGHIRFLWTV